MIASIALVWGVVSAGCEGSTQQEDPLTPGAEISATKLGHAMNVSLPSTARVLRHEKQQGMDEAILAKLEMSEADWKSFTSGLGITEDDLGPENRAYLGGDSGWWDPGSVPGLVAAQVRLPDVEALNVGLDRRNPARLVVYLLWFQT